MAQHDYDVANADGATVRADLNSVLEAVATLNSGSTAPATTFANQWWFDTANNLLKQRNAANTAWVTVAAKDGSGWRIYHDGAEIEAAVLAWTANHSWSAQVALTGIITPTTLTGNQNNYSPTGLSGANTIRVSADNDRSITGLAGGSTGRIIVIENIGGGSPSGDITLVDESSSSTAANRFALDGDVVIGVDEVAMLKYDAASSRWRMVSGPSAAGSVDVQTFTSSGTWTKPGSGTLAIVECWAGGGSGAQGDASTAVGGGGGGAYVRAFLPLSILGATETVTVGAGGAAVTTTQTDGNAGGNTTFTNTGGADVIAYGGAGGNYDAGSGGGGGGGGALGAGSTPGATTDGGAGGGPNGGAGGSSSAGGDAELGGGGGGASGNNNGGNAVWGGGGGGGGGGTPGGGGNSVNGGAGGGGSNISGSGGTGGTSAGGGAGGAGAADANNATAGSQPGGGGGGSETGDSGAGGAGQIRVTVV